MKMLIHKYTSEQNFLLHRINFVTAVHGPQTTTQTKQVFEQHHIFHKYHIIAFSLIEYLEGWPTLSFELHYECVSSFYI